MRFLTHKHPDLRWVFACRFLFIWIQNRQEIVIKNVNKQLNSPSVKTSGKHERSRLRFNLKQIPFDEISRLRSGPPFTLRMVIHHSEGYLFEATLNKGVSSLLVNLFTLFKSDSPFEWWMGVLTFFSIIYYYLLCYYYMLQITNKRLVIWISCFHSPFLFCWNK